MRYFNTAIKSKTLAKIVCTIGPSSWDGAVLKQMVDNGMMVARINASFADHAELERVSTQIRKLSPKIAIMLDTMGHKIRVTGFNDERLLITGEKITLVPYSDEKLLSKYIATTYPELYKFVSIGNNILIDDGNISLEVVEIKEKEVLCKVVTGGTLKTRKTVNIPNVHLDFPALSEKDIDDIKFAIENNFDLISASFIRNKEDVRLIREVMGESTIKLIAKIEDWEGVKNFEEILDVADGIMVARGDMGVELPIQQIPVLQKQFVQRCREVGKPVIVATQMLESMKENPRPTRAEVADVANAVLDGADMLMLSAETSTGKYPEYTVKTMQDTILEIEKIYAPKVLDTKTLANQDTDTLCKNLAAISKEIEIKGVVVLSKTGKTVASLSRQRLNIPIYGVCNSILLMRQFNMYFGVEGIYVNTFAQHRDEVIKQIVGVVYAHGNLDLEDKVAIISGSSIYNKSINSILEIVKVKEVLG